MKYCILPILFFIIVNGQIMTDNPNLCFVRRIRTKVCRIAIPQPPQLTSTEPPVEIVYDKNSLSLVR